MYFCYPLEGRFGGGRQKKQDFRLEILKLRPFEAGKAEQQKLRIIKKKLGPVAEWLG